MRVSAQLYTVREFTKTDDDVKRTMARIREIGYDAVQISGIAAYHPKAIAAALKENGLTVCGTHTPLERIIGETDAVIEEHKLFGTNYVGLGYFRGNYIADYRGLLDRLAPAIEKINAAGMRFLYHNHEHEFMRLDGGVRPLDYMREHTEAGKFDFLPDFYWIQTAGCSPLAFMEAFAGRTPLVHFKDMRVRPSDDKTNMAEIFEGNMDYDSIYDSCVRHGVEWVSVEQDTCDGDPFVSLKKSLDNMRDRGMFRAKK